MAPHNTLIIIYNADATLMGKLRYAYRKLSSPKTAGPACAACDITHGGLSLNESADWTRVKSEIEASGWEVLQWHRDQMSAAVKDWTKTNGIRCPVVLSRGEKDELQVVASSDDLASYQGQPGRLLEGLQAKGILPAKASL